MNQPDNNFDTLKKFMDDQIAGAKDPIHEINQRLKDSLKKDEEELHIRKAWADAHGIFCHSFDEKIIQACHLESNELIERIISGESTFEEEEAILLMKWRAIKNLEN